MTTGYRLMLEWSRRLCTSVNRTATEVRSLYEERREQIFSEFVLPFAHYLEMYLTKIRASAKIKLSCLHCFPVAKSMCCLLSILILSIDCIGVAQVLTTFPVYSL